MFAIMRPDSWNLPLLVHVAGAMALVAALVVVLALAAHGLRRGDDAAALARPVFRTLLIGVLPAYLVMRVGAEWIYSEEALGDDAAWTDDRLRDLGARPAADPDRDRARVARFAPRERRREPRGRRALGGPDRRLPGRHLGDDGEARLTPPGPPGAGSPDACSMPRQIFDATFDSHEQH